MIDTKRKEEISKSYLNAICAVNGIAMQIQEHDDDGIDALLHKVVQKSNGGKYNARISVQLKASATDYTEYPNHYSYPLKKKNYDDLRMPSTNKSFLFLLILPANESDWISQSINELVIRRCMYWQDLSGLPDSSNTSSVTVQLPKSNVVTTDVIEDMLVKIAEGVI